MGRIADDFRNGCPDSARGAAYLAPSEPGGRSHSHCKLLHRLVSVFRFAA